LYVDIHRGIDSPFLSYSHLRQTRILLPKPAWLSATNNTVLFGDLSHYVVRKVKDMSVLKLTERYAIMDKLALSLSVVTTGS